MRTGSVVSHFGSDITAGPRCRQQGGLTNRDPFLIEACVVMQTSKRLKHSSLIAGCRGAHRFPGLLSGNVPGIENEDLAYLMLYYGDTA